MGRCFDDESRVYEQREAFAKRLVRSGKGPVYGAANAEDEVSPENVRVEVVVTDMRVLGRGPDRRVVHVHASIVHGPSGKIVRPGCLDKEAMQMSIEDFRSLPDQARLVPEVVGALNAHKERIRRRG